MERYLLICNFLYATRDMRCAPSSSGSCVSFTLRSSQKPRRNALILKYLEGNHAFDTHSCCVAFDKRARNRISGLSTRVIVPLDLTPVCHSAFHNTFIDTPVGWGIVTQSVVGQRLDSVEFTTESKDHPLLGTTVYEACLADLFSPLLGLSS